MSLSPEAPFDIPESTKEVAHAALPKGNRYMQMRAAMGTIYTNAQFADLYPADGHPLDGPRGSR